jgi:hypothetical protein
LRITYTPDDGEKREWQFKGRTLMATEAEAIEKVTGILWGEFSARLMQGSPTAKRGLLWALLKREEPTLRYGDMDFPIGAAEVELDDEEKADIRAAIMRSPNLSEDERREALAQLGGDDPPVEPASEDGPKDDEES